MSGVPLGPGVEGFGDETPVGEEQNPGVESGGGVFGAQMAGSGAEGAGR